MKKYFFLISIILLFSTNYAQKFVIVKNNVDVKNNLEAYYIYLPHEQTTEYLILKLKKQTETPKIFENKERIKMLSINHNIVIAQVDNCIIHYDFKTGKTDTLFFIFSDTQITPPEWSPNNDKVAFVIYNPNKTHNYTTNYRLIVITLNNGKVVKKEKTNIEISYNFDLKYNPTYFETPTKLVYEKSEYNSYTYELSGIQGSENIDYNQYFHYDKNTGKFYTADFISKIYNHFAEDPEPIIVNNIVFYRYGFVNLKTKKEKKFDFNIVSDFIVSKNKKIIAFFIERGEFIDGNKKAHLAIFDTEKEKIIEYPIYYTQIENFGIIKYRQPFSFLSENKIKYIFEKDGEKKEIIAEISI